MAIPEDCGGISTKHRGTCKDSAYCQTLAEDHYTSIEQSKMVLVGVSHGGV